MTSLLKKVALYSALITGLTLSPIVFGEQPSPSKPSGYPSRQEREAKRPLISLIDAHRDFYPLFIREAGLAYLNGTDKEFEDKRFLALGRDYMRVEENINRLGRQLLIVNGISVRPEQGIIVYPHPKDTSPGSPPSNDIISVTVVDMKDKTKDIYDFRNQIKTMEYIFNTGSPLIQVEEALPEKMHYEKKPPIERKIKDRRIK